MNLNVPSVEEVIPTNKLTKYDRIEVLSKFITSQKFMEIVKLKIFDEEKCCDNANCKFNLFRNENESQKYDDRVPL